MNQQLALSIQLNDEASFTDFCWHGNELLHQQIQATLAGSHERLLYLWGRPGSGKSHVLQACCQAVKGAQSAIYLPLHTLKPWGPQSIDGFEEKTLIGLDDIDAIAGDSTWEEALFHLYNRIRDQGETILIMTGQLPPSSLAIHLPDLRSRLAWGLVIQLNELSDQDKINTLKRYAKKRGFDLPNSVGQFLLTRHARSMHDLHTLLNRLDEASLRAQRRITIPFVKETLGL